MAHLAGAAVTAGVLGGLPSTVHALARRHDVLEPLRAAGTLLVRDAVRPAAGGAGGTDGRLLAAGLAVHAVVSTGWAAVLLPLLGRRRHPVLLGAAAGAALGLAVRPVAGRIAPRLAALPALPQLADHVAYGALVGWSSSRPGGAVVPRAGDRGG